MENHPIPQNVTGFQFKLIGDITIKQFVYLAAGSVSGWFFFSLPIAPFVKFPLSSFFILVGISFAFIPIAGRPIDVMVANFIKSLFNPTLYIYRKTGQGSWLPNEQPVDEFEKQKEKEETLEKELEDAKTKEAKLDKKSPTSFDVHQKVISLEEQLQEILAQKEQLYQQIVDLQKKLNLQKETILTSTALGSKTPTQSVRKVPKTMTKDVGLILTPDNPNIIAGIVTDPRGNPLPNILVEIKDKENNPVRAFKTSVLGQFASATALSNGAYIIEFEDPKAQNKFDTIELGVKGEVIMPIEVKSVDTREELRRSLFGQHTNQA